MQLVNKTLDVARSLATDVVEAQTGEGDVEFFFEMQIAQLDRRRLVAEQRRGDQTVLNLGPLQAVS